MRVFLRWDLWLIAICSVGLLFMVVSIVCDTQRVFVQKRIPIVQMNFFKRSSAFKQESQEPDEDASSQWNFECASEMDYSFLEKQKSGDNWLVRLKIDGVRVRLALPVKVSLPYSASTRLNAHEEGHVDICKRVYEKADNHAREAIHDIMQRSYAGEGATVDEATQRAVGVAARELADIYRRQTADVVNDVSEIYDFLQRKPGSVPGESVVEAFERYSAGKPRRVSRAFDWNLDTTRLTTVPSV